MRVEKGSDRVGAGNLVLRWTKTGLNAIGILALAAMPSLAEQPRDPPDVRLAIPQPLHLSSVRRFKAGEDIVGVPPFNLTTRAAMTQYLGGLGPGLQKKTENDGWTVQVYANYSKKVAAVCAARKAGKVVNLGGGTGLMNPNESFDWVARVRSKNVPWGSAISFLSQTTQDAALYAPHNFHLKYNIWGVTAGRRYTVIASSFVSHPRLIDWWDRTRELRVAHSMKELKQDRDYKLIETCKPEEFTPKLTTFERLLDSLTIR